MRSLDFIESKDSDRFCLIAAGRHPIDNSLERNVGQRKSGQAEHETAKKTEMHAARHLEQRVKGRDRSKTTQEPGQAYAAIAARHGQRIQDRAVANQVQYGVDALWVEFAHAARESRIFQ